ncbi:hypothetical protein SEA_JACOREN57_27 [Mycobacterium phage JacoRen57]|nr:hypothetical protein SEA_JACOREN57_27 [Mycobacterium phage JacoRen57]
MAHDNETWFTKWLRNGRLSGLTFLVIFVTWVAFTVAKLPTEGLTPILLLSGGAFVGNLAIKKEQDDRSVAKRVEKLEEKVDNNDSS